MASRGRRGRSNTSSSTAVTATPEAPPIERTLPADLLLEIIARSDPATLVRCAATCKLLRRDILSPVFIRRVATHRVLAYFDADLCEKKDLSLVHPPCITPAAESLYHDHLARFLPRRYADISDQYYPIASRRGLVVLRRYNVNKWRRPRSRRLCIYDPMTGARTFLSYPPNVQGNDCFTKYILLTAADGIDAGYSSFLLNAAYLKRRTVKIQATVGSSGTWGPLVTYTRHHLADFPEIRVKDRGEPAVVHGGVIHWLEWDGDIILTYDVRSTKMGTLKLPPTTAELKGRHLHLGTSPDGKLLKLLAAVGGNDGAVIRFHGSGDRSANTVLLWYAKYCSGPCLVLDLETKVVHRQEWNFSVLLEIDLPSRLQAMKIFT